MQDVQQPRDEEGVPRISPSLWVSPCSGSLCCLGENCWLQMCWWQGKQVPARREQLWGVTPATGLPYCCPAVIRQCHAFTGTLEKKKVDYCHLGSLCSLAAGRYFISLQIKACLFSSSCTCFLAFSATGNLNVAFLKYYFRCSRPHFLTFLFA